MATKSHGRIPPKPDEFFPYIIRTDNHQLSDDPLNPGHARYERWGWKVEESEAWTAFRDRSEELFPVFNDKNFKDSTTKEQVLHLIREVQQYDHGKIKPHRLLDKISLKGKLDDWQKFNIKRSTSLAKRTSPHSPDVSSYSPALSIRSNSGKAHVLAVTNPAAPGLKALPKGIRYIAIYRYIGHIAPQPYRKFQYMGAAKRGLFLSTFVGETFDHSLKYYAWYYAVYVSNTGAEGKPSNIIKMMIADL